MNIGVNYRLALASQSGIPMFMRQLYSRLPQIDQANNYVLMQPDHTLSAIGTIAYDNLTMLKKIREQHIGLLHGPAHTLPIIKPSGTKYLLTVHDLSFLILPEMGSWDFKLTYGAWLRRSAQIADHIATDSDSTKRDVMHYFKVPSAKITTVHLGVDAAFKPVKSKTNEKYLLTVATHPKRKNLRVLVQAFLALSKTHNLHLKAVGQLSEEDMALLDAAGLKDKVEHHSYVPQDKLIALYQNATVFVYPSLYEGFGLPVLEAMACGVPALCSDNSSLPEVQPDAKQRFNPNNLNKLKDILTEILTTPSVSQAMSKTNIENAKKLTWDKTAREYKAIMTKLLNS